MRYLLFALLLIITVAFKPAVPKPYTLTAEKGKYIKFGAARYLIVPVTLTNNTNDTLKYAGMSCSREDLYRIDSKSLAFVGTECDKNVPVLLKLNPHSSTQTQLKLKISADPSSFAEMKYRIGFNLLVVHKDESVFGLIESKKKNIIWSDVVAMDIR